MTQKCLMQSVERAAESLDLQEVYSLNAQCCREVAHFSKHEALHQRRICLLLWNFPQWSSWRTSSVCVCVSVFRVYTNSCVTLLYLNLTIANNNVSLRQENSPALG